MTSCQQSVDNLGRSTISLVKHRYQHQRQLAVKAPSLALLGHLASRDTFAGALFDRNDENLRRWLRDPPAMKPGSKMPDLNLSEQDIDSLVAYLGTLK